LPLDLLRPLLENGASSGEAASSEDSGRELTAGEEVPPGLTAGKEAEAPAVAASVSRAEPGHNGPG
jgi:hypothetical protein